jgi:C1A family cysteine protease
MSSSEWYRGYFFSAIGLNAEENISVLVNRTGDVGNKLGDNKYRISMYSGIYNHVSGNILGKHAVLLIGYVDQEEYFIVKNSSGPTWGEEGYFRIAYSEMKNDVAFAKFDLGWRTVHPGRLPFLFCHR